MLGSPAIVNGRTLFPPIIGLSTNFGVDQAMESSRCTMLLVGRQEEMVDGCSSCTVLVQPGHSFEKVILCSGQGEVKPGQKPASGLKPLQVTVWSEAFVMWDSEQKISTPSSCRRLKKNAIDEQLN